LTVLHFVLQRRSAGSGKLCSRSSKFFPTKRVSGGGRGIRTPGTLSGTAVFKTARFDRSRIPPWQTSGGFSPVYNSHPAFEAALFAQWLNKWRSRTSIAPSPTSCILRREADRYPAHNKRYRRIGRFGCGGERSSASHSSAAQRGNGCAGLWVG